MKYIKLPLKRLCSNKNSPLNIDIERSIFNTRNISFRYKLAIQQYQKATLDVVDFRYVSCFFAGDLSNFESKLKQKRIFINKILNRN